jgi:hypothetical protein
MVYQAPREQCLPNWPKTGGFDLGKKDLPVAPLLIFGNLPHHPDFAGWTLRNTQNQETL